MQLLLLRMRRFSPVLIWLWLVSALCVTPCFGQGVIESNSFHGRFSLGLAYGPSRTLAPCLRLQSDSDLDIARDDCGFAEGVIVYGREFFRSVGNQVWARGVVDLHLKTNMQRTWSDTQGSGDDALVLSNRNFYTETGNFLQHGEVIWFGNRSYDYEDLWLLDLRLLDQHGPGLGVQKIKLGIGEGGVAFFRVSSRLGGPAQDTLDLRWSGLPLFEGLGKLVFITTQTGSVDAKSGEKKYEAMSGWQTGFIYTWEDENLIHKWAVQYGKGLYGGSDTTSFNEGRGVALNDTGEERDPTYLMSDTHVEERLAMKKSHSFRLADQLDVVPIESPWSLHVGAAYEQVDFGGLRYEKDAAFYRRGDMRTFTYALRPAYDLSTTYGFDVSLQNVRIDQGYGYRHRDPETGVEQLNRDPVDRRLQRLSLGFIIRPLAYGYAELRSYLAHSRWNDAVKRDITQGAFRTRSEGITGGLTLNIWW